ncbi:uncharacterized protein LOC121870907 isoform X2 [Homarus americanus]|uniref:uncharacterized protein LOC121870907 isoform X2 n=1 Tax=Homarus americanus TaxID=6706 RepID=UPI001C486C52|nr:uncharacterized protein LOC121870907 isoform X2 [Homarus americanus]
MTCEIASAIFILMFIYHETARALPLPARENGELLNLYQSAGVVLGAVAQSTCCVILLNDVKESHSSESIFDQLVAPWGVGLLEVAVDGQDANVTQAQLSRVVDEARRLRQVSWCVTVVVVSDDPAFLAAFAEWSLKGRLLVWSTRLLAVTRLPLPELQHVLTSHWTYSMMNAMVLILEDTQREPRFSLYVHLPYTTSGARVERTAFWTKNRGLVMINKLHIFPDKFDNFFGASIDVTALPYKPYWGVEADQSYVGSDAMMLKSIGHSLNFTFHVLPTANWAEVTRLVEERISFIAPVSHTLLPQRSLLYDYTYAYEHVFMHFFMTKPLLSSNWQSLYDPLADEVWTSILVVLLLMPLLLIAITRPEHGEEFDKKLKQGDAAHIVVGTFLDQSVNKRHIVNSASRVLVAAWLVFSFIVGTAYRSNLTAALTLPKYPSRPETLEQLVRVADKVTMAPYGEEFRQFFKQSESDVFHALSEIMHIVPSTAHGLQWAAEKKLDCTKSG